MRTTKRLALLLAAAGGLALWATSSAAGEFVSVRAAEIQWADAPSVGPGAKIAVLEGDLKKPEPFTMRPKLPPNLKIGVHTHPAVERVTVLSGRFYFATGERFDAKKAKEYRPGDAFFVPLGMPMYAYTKKQETVIQIHGTGPWGIKFLETSEAPTKK